MKRFFLPHIGALALVLLAGACARADNIPPDQIQWTYNFSPSAPAVLADGNSSAGVTFTNEPTKAATGSSDVVATNLRVFSSALASSPDKITGSNGNYTLTLTLSTTDNTGTHTGSLSFSGTLFTPPGKGFSSENANVSNTFTNPAPQALVLGSVTFTVSLTSYTPPGPPDQANAGSISAHVEVSGTTVQGVPEPATILLSGLGLTFLGGAAWRKRRRAARA
jgi:hypothetical protein